MEDLAERSIDAPVIVLGDVMLDGWLRGTAKALCREAPAPVVALEDTEHTCGGAANTAANLAALGARVRLLGVVGDDQNGERLRERLATTGVIDDLVTVPGRATVGKRRLVAAGQVVARVDEGSTDPLPDPVVDRLAAALRSAVDAADRRPVTLVLCDYATGTLPAAMIERIAELRHRVGVLTVDAHDVGRWRPVRPTLVTPSAGEVAELLGAAPAGARADWAAALGPVLRERTGATIVAVTLDRDGAVVHTAERPPYRTTTRPVPDNQTAGAGDAYTAAFTLALVAGARVPAAAEAAQQAASAAVRGTGTALVGRYDLDRYRPDRIPAVADPDELAAAVAARRARGERIVFTNGCFDVLHAGHAGYLAQARALGDALVVAVNSDASVRRLKGPDRPVNRQEDRAALVAALGSVDHVVVFDDDTPAALVERLRPDVYVKGGDYLPQMLPERDVVESYGGRVCIVDYLPDRSSTAVIARIRAQSGA